MPIGQSETKFPILIWRCSLNCLQAYLSCWGGEGVCNGMGWNDVMLLCKTGAAGL